MVKVVKDVFYLPSLVLFVLGLVDLLRGFMHTFLLRWSADAFAQLDLTTNAADQLFLLGIYGISNYLTGVIYLLISRKARNLSPYILGIIPLVYFFGIIVLRLVGVFPESTFNGKYFMLTYFGVCILTFINFMINKNKKKSLK